MKLEMEIICQLLIAAALGALVGLEREIRRKGAGIRTYSLVTLGTCLFTVISFLLYETFALQTSTSFDASRIIQAVAIGIGFIGAGVIFHQGPSVVGLTTAAGLWVSAGIGIAVGIKQYILASVVTCIALLILIFFEGVEELIFKRKSKKEEK